jgi:hypothetical protein
MSSILDMLTGPLGSALAQQVAGKIGADQGTTSKAMAVAMPLLISALAKNASSPQGAESLHNAISNDHDGGILDDVMGFLGNPAAANGAGILKHVLGGQQETVQQGISKASGLDANAVASLLQIAAPLVMGALGKATAQQGLDANGLSQFLGGQQQALKSNPQSSGVMGMLGGLLDQNNDGNIADDVINLAGKFFGGRK